jgi:hypothetical protein
MHPPDCQVSAIGVTGESPASPTASDAYAAEQCRAWLNWSAAQIEVSLNADAAANDQLLVSLTEILRAEAASAPDAVCGTMSAVIVAVQFHDRLMQSLRHVAQSLRALHEHIGDPGRAGSAESWRVLRDRQFHAFSMSEERALFAALVAHQDERRPEAGLSSDIFGVLFADDDATGDA